MRRRAPSISTWARRSSTSGARPGRPRPIPIKAAHYGNMQTRWGRPARARSRTLAGARKLFAMRIFKAVVAALAIVAAGGGGGGGRGQDCPAPGGLREGVGGLKVGVFQDSHPAPPGGG